MSGSPIEQFEVHNIGSSIIVNGMDIAFTNSALVMGITTAIICLYFYIALKKYNIIPNKMQAASEIGYDFISSMVKDNIPGNSGKKFLPLIYSIFLFFLVGNIIGLVPSSFAFTSQIIITMSIALLVLFITLVYGVYLHGIKVLKIFAIPNIPLALAPFMMILEFISFFAKCFSMGIRLFANIMAGHMIIEIIGGFIIALGIFGIIPLSFTIVLYGFELAIAFIQAYIFTILSCLFINQVVNLH